MLVLAGPGSGKTTVIVKRILYLIQERHIPPEEILVVTFTKDAALSMQQRFLQQADRVLPVNFGTFHSVFYHILRQSHYFKVSSSGIPAIYTHSQKKSILLPIMKEKCMQREGYFDYDSLKSDGEALLGAISFYKNTRNMEEALKQVPKEWKLSFEGIFEEYQARCRKQGGLDFDDMVYECRRFLLEDADALRYWQGRFRYILIDEFQDINPLQYEVVKLLGQVHGNLFAVGDDDQAIYGFRGSHPACLRQFAEELQAVRVVLDANYRSSVEIVKASGKVIADNRDRFLKQCYAAGADANERDSVRIQVFESRAQELAYLTEQLAAFLKACPTEHCAVLFRTNAYMQNLAVMLTKEGIPYHMRERSGSPYEHFVARDVMSYLYLAAGDRSREHFLHIMNRPVRYLSRDALADMEQVDFQRMKAWYGKRGRPGDEKCIRAIQKLEEQLTAMGRMPLKLAIHYLCRAIGYEEYLKSRKESGEHLEEWLDILDFLREDAGGYENVGEWSRAQKQLANTEKTDAEKGEAQPAICLMTVHASKGLEFDRVYIPDCNEKVFPHGTMPESTVVEEERRIFYVGMTRAKKYLELLCITGTRERPRLISRFLNPLKENYSSNNSSNSQLSRYSSKASITFSYSSSSSI
jgi:DNA helicase-2/ATP-dependent DNA helicase PcrA